MHQHPVNQPSAETPGNFVDRSAGLLWRPSGSKVWQQVLAMQSGDQTAPAWIAAWRDSFVVVYYDYALNRSTFFNFDPATGQATATATLDGFVGRTVTDTGLPFVASDGSWSRWSSTQMGDRDAWALPVCVASRCIWA